MTKVFNAGVINILSKSISKPSMLGISCVI